MNPIDPNRSTQEQLDHDVRGLRMEVEILGRLLKGEDFRGGLMERVDRLEQKEKRRTMLENTLLGAAIVMLVTAISSGAAWIISKMGKD